MSANTVELALIIGTSAMLVTCSAQLDRLQRYLIQRFGPRERQVALMYFFSLAMLVGSVGIILCRQADLGHLPAMAGRLP